MTRNIKEVLGGLNLSRTSTVSLRCLEREDVFHYTDDYHGRVLQNTNVIGQLASLLRAYRTDVWAYGASVLEEFRENGWLDEYERDHTFSDYLCEIIADNYYEVAAIDFTTEKYDHKRGRCTIEASVDVPLWRVLDNPDAIEGWEASVKTAAGTLVLG